MTLRLLLIIGIGGFLGTIARYLSQQLVYRFYPATFPMGTLAVNVTGCLLIGIIMSVRTASKGAESLDMSSIALSNESTMVTS